MLNAVSYALSEIGGIFRNFQTLVPLRITVQEFGHPQPPNLIQTDNSITVNFANSVIKIKRTKAIDTNFHLIKDRVGLKEFLVYWRPGPTNLGDNFTKYHSAAYHRLMRSTYIHH